MASLTRQIVFAIDPEQGFAGTYSWVDVPDLNADEKGITAVHVPPTKTANINPMQETVFIGTMGVGKMFQSFRDDLSQDGEEDVNYEAITNRLDPSLVSDGRRTAHTGSKRLLQLEFPSLDSAEEGATIEYALDTLSPTEGATWLILLGGAGERRSFRSALCRWFHLRISGKNANPATLLLSAFKVIYYDLEIPGD